MTAVDIRNLIGKIDLDKSIYRIYSLKWFLNLLSTGMDGLRNPSRWDDPFENFFLSRTKIDIGQGQTATFGDQPNDWYGQCWTTNCDTDAMWRIYSHNRDGVQVKTTVRKLFGNLCKVQVWSPRLQFFVGKVDYKTQEQIKIMMSKMTFTDVALRGNSDEFAQMLCIKRESFEHEREVRILYQSVKDAIGPKGVDGTVDYPLDANEVFDEILLDPRLTDAEAKAVAAGLDALGWKGGAPRSSLYEAPDFTIQA